MGQDGKAQLADGLQMEEMGEAGERENLDEVVEGGEGSDFREIRMGLIQAKGGEGDEAVEKVGEVDNMVKGDGRVSARGRCEKKDIQRSRSCQAKE